MEQMASDNVANPSIFWLWRWYRAFDIYKSTKSLLCSFGDWFIFIHNDTICLTVWLFNVHLYSLHMRHEEKNIYTIWPKFIVHFWTHIFRIGILAHIISLNRLKRMSILHLKSTLSVMWILFRLVRRSKILN